MRKRIIVVAAVFAALCGCSETGDQSGKAREADLQKLPPLTITIGELRKRGLHEIKSEIRLEDASDESKSQYAEAVVTEGFYYGPKNSPMTEADREWYCPVPEAVNHKNDWTDEEKATWLCRALHA